LRKRMAEEGEEVPPEPLPPKVLIVVTSTETFPDGSPCGFWLAEAVHPFLEFTKHGWAVEYASIAGTAVADPKSIEAADPETLAWWEDEANKALLAEPKKLADIPLEDVLTVYEAILFVGGFGAAWDFPECAEAQALVKTFYEGGKVVAGVCHGPLAFVNVVLSDETKLLAEKDVCGFSNPEEAMMEKLEVVQKPNGPGTFQDFAVEQGAKFQIGLPMEPLVVKMANLFTAQNPASAGPLATAIVYYYDPIKAEFEPPRLTMLKRREVLVAEIQKADTVFATSLADLKKQEAAGGAVSGKLEELQYKAVAGRQYRAALLADLDMQIERNATRRQAALDAAEAAKKAAAEEE